MSAPKILIIDDDENIRFSLSMILEDLEYNVIVSASGKEALEIVKKEKISIAIVDLSIPDIPGDKIVFKIHETFPEIACLIHTGNLNFNLSLDLVNIGLTEKNIIYKPIDDFNKLNERIKSFLS